MSETDSRANLPAQIVSVISAVPKALVPASVKALDRLIGAAVDVPVAWLAQQKAKIDAQTGSFTLVEGAIAAAAAAEAGADDPTVKRAVSVLVRKAYRTQANREAVAAAMLEDLTADATLEAGNQSVPPETELDDDWLNVFERYAEDATSERMQKLWGRVLAGEVRRPGRFSPRTLRFLSEFSQVDAVTFEQFAKCSFGDSAPSKLVKPPDLKDIRELIYLEASGLVQGVNGLGLSRTISFNQGGHAFIREGNLVIVFRGVPGTSISSDVVALTPLGQELVSLLPGRDARAAARAVAQALRVDEVEEAFLAVVTDPAGTAQKMEVLWQKASPPLPFTDYTASAT